MTSGLPSGYSERYVLYADVLGFRRIVEKIESGTSEGQHLLRKIYNASLKIQQNVFQTNVTSSMQSDQPRCAMFSDCIVVSTVKSESGLLGLLIRALSWQMMLMEQGIFARGGITRGLIWQDDGVLMGSGLNTAYEMERTCAVYPRVLVADGVYQDIENVADKLRRRLLKELCIQDADEKFMLTLFHPQMASDGQTSGAPYAEAYLRRVAAVVKEAAITNAADEKVMKKYTWLSNKLNNIQKYWRDQGHLKEIIPIALE